MYAIIDIGTNSTLLLISHLVNKQFLVIDKNIQSQARIGKGINDENFNILEPSLKKCVDVLLEYKSLIGFMENVHVLGTHAFRKAKNRDWVVDYIKEKTGFAVKVITEDEEATYSFMGAKEENERSVVLDIGGGSSELAVGNTEPEARFSMPIGAISLYEKFKPTYTTISTLFAHIDSHLNNLDLSKFNAPKLVVVGGTATTLSSVKLSCPLYDFSKLHNVALTVTDVRRIFYDIISKPLVKRNGIVGLPPERRDIIVPGISILLRVMKKLGRRSTLARETGVRFGYLKKLALEDTYGKVEGTHSFTGFSIHDKPII